jgi:hypothetical protein
LVVRTKEKEKKHAYDGSYACFGGETRKKKDETRVRIVRVFRGVWEGAGAAGAGAGAGASVGVGVVLALALLACWHSGAGVVLVLALLALPLALLGALLSVQARVVVWWWLEVNPPSARICERGGWGWALAGVSWVHGVVVIKKEIKLN